MSKWTSPGLMTWLGAIALVAAGSFAACSPVTRDFSSGTGGGAGNASSSGGSTASCMKTVTKCAAGACGRVDDGCGDFIACDVACQVDSASPRVANTGDVVLLEGTFNDGATIDFPGASGVVMKVTDGHRASATVPAKATAGALTIHSGNVALDAGDFRRSFAKLGIQDLTGFYSQAECARQMPAMNAGRHEHGSAIVGDWLYVIGGNSQGNGTSPIGSVERLRVNADGSLGDAESLSETLNAPRFGHATVAINDRIYVIGGNDATSALASIESTTVNADGSLAPFTVAASKLKTARGFATANVIGNEIWVVGGNTGNIEVGTVEHATIQADGSLGAFEAAPSSLAFARSQHAAFVTSSELVVVGGSNAGTWTDSIEIAPIKSDGSLGAFASGGQLPGAWANGPVAAWGDALLAFPYGATVGADGAPTHFVDLQINIDGQLHTDGMRASVVRDGVYFTGGNFDGGVDTTVARAGLLKGAALTTFKNSSSVSLPAGRAAGGGFTIGNTLYYVGGEPASGPISPTISRATIRPDDTLGAFHVEATTLPAGRSYFGIAVANGHVFVVGGLDDTNGPTASVFEAPIKSDGSLGAFASAANTLATARYGHATFLLQGELCVAGGSTSAGYTTNVECAAVANDGTLGPFGIEPRLDNLNLPVTLAIERAWPIGAIVGERVYVLFGASTNQPENSGDFSRATDPWSAYATNFATDPAAAIVGGARVEATALQVGDWLYVFGGSPATSTVRADTLAIANGFAPDGSADLQSPLRDGVAYRIGNHAYVIGGLGAQTLAVVQDSLLR